jgi:hypothetical protein
MALIKVGIVKLDSTTKIKEWPDRFACFVISKLNKNFKPSDKLSFGHETVIESGANQDGK